MRQILIYHVCNLGLQEFVAKDTVTIEISVEIPDGVPENVVRTVTENSKTLKFTSHDSEIE